MLRLSEEFALVSSALQSKSSPLQSAFDSKKLKSKIDFSDSSKNKFEGEFCVDMEVDENLNLEGPEGLEGVKGLERFSAIVILIYLIKAYF
jgi:tRNA (Thr-GGU) A37 N-methylase